MTEITQESGASALDNIRIVLVNTSHPGNIGAAARAMKNMGLSKLYLVEPQKFPHDDAWWRAASARDVLENAVVVETLEEAVGDCPLVIGTSARGRRIPWPLVTPRECGERAANEAQSHEVAIIFGREDRGLTNEELQVCNYHVHIPTNPDYSSLNLGCAVQVLSYELRMAHLQAVGGTLPKFDDWDVAPANSQAQEHYFNHLQETLVKLDFLQEDNPRQTMTRLRRLYTRVRMDEMELGILRGVLTATQSYVSNADKKIEALQQELAQAKKVEG